MSTADPLHDRRASTPPASSSSSAPEALAFLQHRVAMFGLVAGGLGLAFLAFRLTWLFAAGLPRLADRPDMLAHFAGAGFLLAVWALCRGGRRSRRFVDAVEAAGLVGSSLSYAAMGAFIPLILRPDLIVLLALTFGLVARAIYVPSSARRTFVLAVAIGLPLIPGAYLAYLEVDGVVLGTLGRMVGALDAPTFARNLAIEVSVWWTLITTLATATSRVVYGLRREVHAARRLGQYVLEEKLGEGGMGVVYRASHAMLRRPTAVKLLPPERSSERDVLRFEREVRLTARLSHPNTVTVFDYGRTAEGVFYYAMELLEGAPLDAAVRAAGPFVPERVAHVLHAVAAALVEAHGIGLIHRDLKPANIILCERGGVPDVPKVVDFGLVKELGGDSALTQADALTGTPLFMSPEAIRAPDAVDGRSDLYALGAIGYFLLTGEPVFTGSTLVEVCAHHLHTAPQPPSLRAGRALPADLERVVMDCLAKEPQARPPGAVGLRARLAGCASFGRWTEERARAWWREHETVLADRRGAGSKGLTGWTAFTTQTRGAEPELRAAARR